MSSLEWRKSQAVLSSISTLVYLYIDGCYQTGYIIIFKNLHSVHMIGTMDAVNVHLPVGGWVFVVVVVWLGRFPYYFQDYLRSKDTRQPWVFRVRRGRKNALTKGATTKCWSSMSPLDYPLHLQEAQFCECCLKTQHLTQPTRRLLLATIFS